MTSETPPWPGEPKTYGFTPLPEDDANDWVYTLWKDKMWFCSVYNGEVNVNNIRNKEDVERAVFKNNLIAGVLNSTICGRIEFFFDNSKKICGVEITDESTEETSVYICHERMKRYRRYLEYLVREE